MSAEHVGQIDYKPLADAPGTVEIEKQLEWYKLIHLGRLLDDKARNYLRQAKGWSIMLRMPPTTEFRSPWD